MKHSILLRVILAGCLSGGPLFGETGGTPMKIPVSLKDAKPAGLVLPSKLPLNDYERVLYDFLFTRKYQQLGWAVDKSVRDTGPFLNLKSYGTHPAVRIYYSPEIITWLVNGRVGAPADGAMIIKEMFAPPAIQYEELKKNPAFANDPQGYERALNRLLSAWTVMVKDSSVSKDGWFWAGPGAPVLDKSPGKSWEEKIKEAVEAALDSYAYDSTKTPPFTPPNSSASSGTCLRCHGSAEKEVTFTATENIAGFQGAPITFRTDDSWRSQEFLDGIVKDRKLSPDDPYVKGFIVLEEAQRPYIAGAAKAPEVKAGVHAPGDVVPLARLTVPLQDEKKTALFRAIFPEIANQTAATVRSFPSSWADHVPARPGEPQHYLTADNCLGCHGGLGGAPDGIVMFLQTGPKYGDGFNVSEFGEWRWSPMGLAGRDPIFHAQLESEMVFLENDAKAGVIPAEKLKDTQQAVIDTCLSCHGAMGVRQLREDIKNGRTLPNGDALNPHFNRDYFFITPALTQADTKQPHYDYHAYGGLAREGIGCAVCHHIAAPDPAQVRAAGLTELSYGLFHNNTGRFETGLAKELNGPYGPDDGLLVLPMENALGITPKLNPFIKDSLMCGTCHTINLPNIGEKKHPFPILDESETVDAFKPFAHSIEQATFLEWQNSSFAGKGKDAQTCQECHMRGSFESPDKKIKIGQIVTQIASIEDSTYPDADNRLPLEKITAPLRKDFKRHKLAGLNAFLLEMFNQNEAILGVSKTDYMTSATNGTQLAIDGMVQIAEQLTADLAVKVDSLAGQQLNATVTVTNKAGHRFPSGVAFRRAFLELCVVNRQGDVVWGSGRTNSVGVIVDGAGQPLRSEFFENGAYQSHYGGTAAPAITGENQVQIYEELIQDAAGKFTTSFIHRVDHIKDNRLLPRGWREASHFAGPDRSAKILEEFMQATDPHGVEGDPDYQDPGDKATFLGQDSVKYQITLPPGVDPAGLTVQAALYYQAIPPSYLKQRFTTAPNGEATRLLYYLTSRLKTEASPIENWKLPLVRASAPVKP
jgi:mono/diheme cytochrome c family protein